MPRAARFMSISSLLAVLLATGGCGEPAATSPTAKQKSAPATPAKEKLVGRWQGGTVVNQAAAAQIILDASDEPQLAEQAKAIVEHFRNMSMTSEFKPDGTLVIAGYDGEFEGTWEVVSEEGDQVTLKTIESENSEKEFTVTFDGDDAFLIQPPEAIADLGVFRFERLR